MSKKQTKVNTFVLEAKPDLDTYGSCVNIKLHTTLYPYESDCGFDLNISMSEKQARTLIKQIEDAILENQYHNDPEPWITNEYSGKYARFIDDKTMKMNKVKYVNE